MNTNLIKIKDIRNYTIYSYTDNKGKVQYKIEGLYNCEYPFYCDENDNNFYVAYDFPERLPKDVKQWLYNYLYNNHVRPTAVKSVCNTLAIGLYNIDNCEPYVTVKYTDEKTKPRKHKLYYDDKRQCDYFILNNSKEYLNEYIRTDY